MNNSTVKLNALSLSTPESQPELTRYSILTILLFIIANVFTIYPIRFPMRLFRGHGQVIRVRVDYASAPLIACAVLLASGSYNGTQFIHAAILGDSSTLQPWQVLVLFFSMSYLCISLELTGILRFLANKVLGLAGGSGMKLLCAVFMLASIFTLFSSNDIVVLTLSPMLLHMCRETGTNPLPFLYTCFFAANTASMIWYLGNSTNIVVTMSFHINPYHYTCIMAPVTLFVHFAGFAATSWYFQKSLPAAIDVIDQRNLLILDPIGGLFLALLGVACMVLLFVAGFTNFPVWAITLTAAAIAFWRDFGADLLYPNHLSRNIDDGHAVVSSVSDIHLSSTDDTLKYTDSQVNINMIHTNHGNTHEITDGSPHVVQGTPLPEPVLNESRSTCSPYIIFPHLHCNLFTPLASRFPRLSEFAHRIPWAVFPFLVGEFGLVDSLERTGVVSMLGSFLYRVCQTSAFNTAIVITSATALLCTCISNLPATVLLSKVIASPTFLLRADGTVALTAQLAIVLGSNVGPCLSLPGCLAGLIWAETLAANGVPMRPSAFTGVGIRTMTLPLVIGALVLGLLTPKLVAAYNL